MIKKWFKRTALIVGALLVFAMPAQATDYEVEIFMAPGATAYSPANGINNNGDAVGPNENSGYIYRSNGDFEGFSAPAGALGVAAKGINNNDTIVGSFVITGSGYPTRGFIFNGSTYTYLQAFYNWSTWANDISEEGTIVGHAAGSGLAPIIGFTYKAGAYTHIKHPLGARYTQLRGISSDGITVIGQYYGNDSIPHAFMYDGSVFTDLPDVDGATETVYTDINVNGIACGYYRAATGEFHAFVYDTATDVMESLPTTLPGWYSALGINDNGDVAGVYREVPGSGARYGFVIRVATEPPPPPPTELSIDINNFKLVKDISNNLATIRVVAHGTALPETLEALPDGSTLESMTVTITLPGLGENGTDLVLTDTFNVIVKSKPTTVQLNK